MATDEIEQIRGRVRYKVMLQDDQGRFFSAEVNMDMGLADRLTEEDYLRKVIAQTAKEGFTLLLRRRKNPSGDDVEPIKRIEPKLAQCLADAEDVALGYMEQRDEERQRGAQREDSPIRITPAHTTHRPGVTDPA